VDADLEKILGWNGAAFHASIHQIHGHGLSGNNLDNLLVVSGIEALPATRLFNLWIEQKFAGGVSIRAGQLSTQVAPTQEFFVSQFGSLFVNATFGWPAIASVNLPSGGPTYPLATPGGWRLIGRTPLTMFRPDSGSLLAIGDHVRFVPISCEQFAQMEKEQAALERD